MALQANNGLLIACFQTNTGFAALFSTHLAASSVLVAVAAASHSSRRDCVWGGNGEHGEGRWQVRREWRGNTRERAEGMATKAMDVI